MCSIDWLSQMLPHMKLQGLNFSLLVLVWFCLDPAESPKLSQVIIACLLSVRL